MTPNSKSSQVIPTQLMHGRSPTHEDRRDLFWLSRLAFQFRRASASLNALPTSAVAVTEEVVEEAKVGKWSKETNKSTRLQSKTLNVMTLGSCLCLSLGCVFLCLLFEKNIDGYCMVCNSTNPSHPLNPMTHYFDTSPKLKRRFYA